MTQNAAEILTEALKDLPGQGLAGQIPMDRIRQTKDSNHSEVEKKRETPSTPTP